MKLSLYPVSKRDQFLFWIGVLNAVLFVIGILIGAVITIVASGSGAALCFALVYLLPEQPSETKSEQYASIINSLAGMGTQLAELSKFLERERKRVADTEMTLTKLRDEKNSLQPILETQRKTVDAILAAHASRVRSTIWKDRIIGFLLGVISSLIAALIYGLFTR